MRLAVSREDLVAGAVDLLRHVVNYVEHEHAVIQADEQVGYGYWSVTFRAGAGGFLDAWEYDAAASTLTAGASRAVLYWYEQHTVCGQANAAFSPPRPDQMAAVSLGVMEGDDLEGVRYPSPPHMSGWWLTTDRYDGDIRSLNVQHLYHVTAARPDIVRYLALPAGYRFSTLEASAVWYDDAVAKP